MCIRVHIQMDFVGNFSLAAFAILSTSCLLSEQTDIGSPAGVSTIREQCLSESRNSSFFSCFSPNWVPGGRVLRRRVEAAVYNSSCSRLTNSEVRKPWTVGGVEFQNPHIIHRF